MEQLEFPDIDVRLEPHLQLMADLHLHPRVEHAPLWRPEPFDEVIGWTTTTDPSW